jgi:hypothetical protein
MTALRTLALLLPLLSACSSAPPQPDWQAGARSALDAAVHDTLVGASRTATAEMDRARAEIGRTGDPARMARAELVLCAARVAGLAFGPCEGFERVRADAAAPELAYAGHLAGQRLDAATIELLPEAQRGAARAVAQGTPPAAASLQSIEDPLSRLTACAVLFQAGQASPEVIALASETASAQGWRRPLLAWLHVQARLAEQSGDAEGAARLQRRIRLAEEGGPRAASGAASQSR